MPPLSRWVAAVCFCLGVVLSASASADITLPPPQPSTLTAVTATESGRDKTVTLLDFTPAAPRFQIVGNDTDHPSIALALSTRGPVAPTPTGGHGLLLQIAYEQDGSVLVLHLNVSGKTHVEAAPVGATAISLTLSSPGAAEAAAAVALTALPRAEDRPPGEDGFEIVFLRYADVSEVVGLLTDGQTVKSNDTFTPQEPAFGSVNGSNNYTPPPPNAQASSDPLAQSVDDAIAIDRRLNAIILKGSPERIARLKAKIEEIDVPVESVLLETVFVELDEQGARNVGLDFNNTSNQIGVATFQTGAFIPSGQETTHGLTSVALQAAVYGQVQAGHGRIVSKPRIAAQSGGTAKIITGDALPILTSIALSGVNAVSQQVQYVNVGVTLQIAPRVSDDGFVTSHVFCVVSSVTGTSQGYPTISQREAETSASVRDGDTFVIGGLTQDSDLRSATKVPGLGQVPGLGELFTYHNDTKAKTELYIVVTPHIVRHGAPTAPAAAAAAAAN
jgi:general secretion pathway protein D